MKEVRQLLSKVKATYCDGFSWPDAAREVVSASKIVVDAGLGNAKPPS